jgi:APA family basic amino acid/polyamine antiporter
LQIITALMLARIVSMFIAQIIGLLIYRRKQPDAPRPFRMWLYPAPALLALAGWVWVFATSAVQPGGWLYVSYAAVTIALGFVGYFLFAWKRGEWPFGDGKFNKLLMPDSPDGAASPLQEELR